MKKKIILAVTVIACMVCSIGATSCTYAEDTNLEYSYSIDNSKTISLKGSTAQLQLSLQVLIGLQVHLITDK